MFKKIIIGLSVFAVLSAVLTGMFLNWARNPYGLELERMGPKGAEGLPEILPAPNSINYLMYSKYDNNSYVIHLPLPNEYIHPSNTTGRIIKTYSVPATVYYPEINGKFHPDNLDLPKCNGWCDGYMRIFIEPDKDAEAINIRRFERIKNDRVRNSPLHLFEELDGEFGIDEHFQIRFPVIEKKRNGNKYATDEFFITRKGDSEIKYLFECSPYTPSPGCKVRFNLSSHPELLVSVTFGRHLMTNWKNIITATDRRISSWGITKVEKIVK